jgi:hypothetical protein
MRSRMNALKHGRAAQKLELDQVMRGLSEDPREFEKLRAELVADIRPRNAVERNLVEDLAKLWWKRQRAERAQLGVQLRDVERMEFETTQALARANRGSLAESNEEIAQVGLRRAADCAAKFREIQNLLELLVARVERRDYSEDAKFAIQMLYGEKPTWRGSLIQHLFKKLLRGDYQSGNGTDEPWPPLAEVWPGSPPDPPDVTAAEARLRAMLVLSLQEESRDVMDEEEAFLSRHLEISPAARLARLAPTDRRWTWLLRMDNMLDRQIERKLTTLARIRRAFGSSGRRNGRRRHHNHYGTRRQRARRASPAKAHKKSAQKYVERSQ